MKVYASHQTLPAGTPLLELYEHTRTSGFQGFSLPLEVFRKEISAGHDEALREALEGISHLEPPILRAGYDFIRSHLEDSSRIAADLEWLSTHGIHSLLLTITQGAHSSQIEDHENNMARQALKKAAALAEKRKIGLILRLTSRHLADSLASAHDILREISSPALCLSLDLESVKSQGHLEPEIAVKYFKKELRLVEFSPAAVIPVGFTDWLAKERPDLQILLGNVSVDPENRTSATLAEIAVLAGKYFHLGTAPPPEKKEKPSSREKSSKQKTGVAKSREMFPY